MAKAKIRLGSLLCGLEPAQSCSSHGYCLIGTSEVVTQVMIYFS
jgi:hypothetical protein